MIRSATEMVCRRYIRGSLSRILRRAVFTARPVRDAPSASLKLPAALAVALPLLRLGSCGLLFTVSVAGSVTLGVLYEIQKDLCETILVRINPPAGEGVNEPGALAEVETLGHE